MNHNKFRKILLKSLRRYLHDQITVQGAVDAVDDVLAVLTAHGIDVKRILEGELKVLPRDPTRSMVYAARQTQGIIEIDEFIKMNSVRKLELSWHKKRLPPPLIQIWHAMWDAET